MDDTGKWASAAFSFALFSVAFFAIAIRLINKIRSVDRNQFAKFGWGFVLLFCSTLYLPLTGLFLFGAVERFIVHR